MKHTDKIKEKNSKKFLIKLYSGKIINKFGKNITVYQDGIFLMQEKIFIPREQIEEIREYEL